jgi:hypothetical protein
MTSRVGAVARVVLIDLFGSVVWFPVWWYTVGLKRVVLRSVQAIQFRVREYGLAIWIKNLFVPMYGQYDFVGRLISVLVRIAVLVGRFVALAIESLLYLLLLLLWVLAPVLFLGLFIMNVSRGSFSGQLQAVAI